VRSNLAIEVEGDSLVRTGASLAVAGFFRDQRPLRGGAGVADWRLCGWLSELVAGTRLRGERGDTALVLTHGRLGAPRLLLLGLGPHSRFDAAAHRDAVRAAIGRTLDLGAATVALDLPAPTHEAAPESAAKGLLEGTCAVLDARPSRLLLRIVSPAGLAPRLRSALEEAAVGLPRGATSIKLVRTPATPIDNGARAARGARPEAAPA
jgi:hypothetical protein